jgi:co-chaperonin GroES (HSP10)
MSELILPPGVYAVPGLGAIPTVEPLEAPAAGASDEEKAKVVPDPTGFKLLCMVPPAKDTFDGTGIVKADMVKNAEEQTSHTLFVLKVGPDAYKDQAKFPSGPWCKEGDFVICRAYAGTRIKLFGREFRLINDDQVDATIEDPRGVARA